MNSYAGDIFAKTFARRGRPINAYSVQLFPKLHQRLDSAPSTYRLFPEIRSITWICVNHARLNRSTVLSLR